MKITKFLLLILPAMTMAVGLYAQTKKPAIMVVPSGTWCSQYGFVQEFGNHGDTLNLPDYQAAWESRNDLQKVIKTVNELLEKRGFTVKTLDESLQLLQELEYQDDASAAYRNFDMIETNVDKLRRVAKADIWVQVTWRIKKTAVNTKTLTFTLQAFDTHSDKQIVEISGKATAIFTTNLTDLFKEALLPQINDFNTQMQRYFTNMITNGREISLRIRLWDAFNGDLETKYDGAELYKILNKWVQENTLQGGGYLSDISNITMLFTQTCIPVYNERGKPLALDVWVNKLQKMLERQHRIRSELTIRGLGTAQLTIIGE